MGRIPTFAVLGFSAVLAGSSFLPGTAAKAATGNARWCAAVNTGFDNVEEICDFQTFEECRPFVLAGNRGFCNENPRYVDVPVRHHKKRRVKG